MRAFVAIRNQPVYRREAFARGLRAAGYDVVLTDEHPGAPRARPGDALVIWNRYGTWHDVARSFERDGGAVLVAENAYVANDRADRRRYALARDGHNGSGWWPIGGPERWRALGIGLAPWRDDRDGGYVLVAPNRSFGAPGFAMPNDWVARTAARLRELTGREVRVRPHPGNDPPRRPFAEDLEGARCVVIWSSSVGCEALIAGVPVICTAPWWICKDATLENLASIETPLADSARRLRAFERLAWAQWHVDEIESGEPFQHLLQRAPAFAGGV